MIFVRMRTGQSTPAWRPDQAVRVVTAASLFALILPVSGVSQTMVRDNEPLFADVGGVRLGRMAQGPVVTGAVRSGHTEITLEGWIFRESLEPSRREGFTLQIARAPDENLRAEPNGRVIARLVQGTVLNETDRRGNWVKVRRAFWVASGSLSRQTAAAPAPAPAPAPARPRTDPPPRQADTPRQRDTAATSAAVADPRRAVVRRRLQLFRAPDSTSIGTLEAGHPVRITARAGNWVRVETQAWVRENEIRLSDAGILSGVTASELRSAPEEYRGRLLRWTIQFLALQTADELRSDFIPGQRYILARGPSPEYAFVYILVPTDLIPAVERLAALASVTVLARVRNGRSAFLANPILELVELL